MKSAWENERDGPSKLLFVIPIVARSSILLSLVKYKSKILIQGMFFELYEVNLRLVYAMESIGIFDLSAILNLLTPPKFFRYERALHVAANAVLQESIDAVLVAVIAENI